METTPAEGKAILDDNNKEATSKYKLKQEKVQSGSKKSLKLQNSFSVLMVESIQHSQEENDNIKLKNQGKSFFMLEANPFSLLEMEYREH